MLKKAVVTCALTGILTDPEVHPVPVTATEMAEAARGAVEAGASVLHVHVRDPAPGRGRFPTWDPDIAAEVCAAIREACPGALLNLTTGVMGDDVSGPLACLERVRPEIAALNSGSLNYLRVRRDGSWAWPPLLFANPVSKIQTVAEAMARIDCRPECECFDTGIVRSVAMFERAGILTAPSHVSFVMGVHSGMPARPAWLPLLIDELPPGADWQVIAIGREEVWALHREAARLGGHLRTGLEDTFYLPDGSRAGSNAELVHALCETAREEGREIASPEEARALLGIPEGAGAPGR